MDQSFVLTREGYEKLEAELNDLISNQRKDVAQKIKEARAQGDLSENAEYDAAKSRQGEIESRIAELDKLLKHAQIIDSEDEKEGVVSLGNRVTVLDVEFEEEETYTIVGSTESDPSKGYISDASPIGQALLGKPEGEIVKVDAPAGEIELKILKIEK